jgi:hypothetical protein
MLVPKTGAIREDKILKIGTPALVIMDMAQRIILNDET